VGTALKMVDDFNHLTSMCQLGAGVTKKRVDYTYNAVRQSTDIKRFSDFGDTQLVAETSHIDMKMKTMSVD
jgi:hypothetical protein